MAMAVCDILTVTAVVFLISVGVCQEQGGSSPQRYPVSEDDPPPIKVANVVQVGGLLQKYPDDFADLEYEFLPSSSEHRTFFRIVGGELETTSVIDRDVICPHLIDCLISLDIRAQLLAKNIFEIIPLTVIVADKNDHVPTFPESQIELSFPESSAPGTSVRLSPADDIDSPRYGINRYELVSSSSTFELKVTNNSDGTVNIHLALKESLDREQAESYRMELRAYDRGNPPQMGAVTITVNVKDNNDNNPVFGNKTYETFVFENVPPFTTIVQVQAQDPDAGPNGEVIYSFTPRTESLYGRLFNIDQTTGEIFVTERLDYEEGDSYTLDVMASDKNPDPLTAIVKVVVHVKDLNDHAPQIMINSDSRDSVEISELADVGAFVAHITVRDPDGGDNGRFNCSLSDDGHFQLQKIYKTEFKIITQMRFDREVKAEYNPELTCQDAGTPPQVQTLKIKVIVKDENDHVPEFSKNVYATSMAENNPVGVFVIQVNASDRDQGSNAEIRFTILGNAANLFDIDHVSGIMTAKVSLDYERLHREGLTSMDVRLMAQDGGSPPQTAMATVKITVIDEDDVPPQFTKTSYIFGVRENLNMNTYVGQVEAEDPDSQPKNKFTFSIDPRYNKENAFRINPNSGKIYTRKMLDREINAVYHLVVMATSTGSPDQTNTTNVFISVLDDNDNSPIVDFPSPLNNTVYVSQDVPVGDPVTWILTRDADTGDNAKLTYNITSSNGGSLFVIVPHTGEVKVASSLKEIRDNNRYFTLFISVHDNGNPVRFYETLLNIVVNKSVEEARDAPLISNHNLTIVITIAAVSGLVMVILLVAIVFIVLSQRKRDRKKYNYMPRMVDQKIMADKTARDNAEGGGVAESKESNKAKMGAAKGGPTGSPQKGKPNPSLDIDRERPSYEKHELQEAGLLHSANNLSSQPYKVGYLPDTNPQKAWVLASQPYQKNPVGLNGYLVSTNPADKADSDSACSADMSNATDSGHGSNEGDGSETHYRPSSPPAWDPTMLPIQEGSDGAASPMASPSKEKPSSNLHTKALHPGVHRKASNNARRDSDREHRSAKPQRSGAYPPPPPRRLSSHSSSNRDQTDSPHLEELSHPDRGHLSRTGGYIVEVDWRHSPTKSNPLGLKSTT